MGRSRTATAETSGDYEYSINIGGTTCTITKYNGSESDVNIPTTLDSYSVTAIGDQAFNSCTSLSSITIPDSVTSIGSYTFWGCTNLSNITIPNSVTEIRDRAFAGCTMLRSVYFDSNLTTIHANSFLNCSPELMYYYPSPAPGPSTPEPSTPEPDPASTTTPTPSPSASLEIISDGSLLFSTDLTDAVVEDGTVVLPVPIEEFATDLSDGRVHQAILSVQIPDSLRTPSGNEGVRKLILQSKILEAAKKERKELTVIMKDEKGKEYYRWNFTPENLDKMKEEGVDLNLPILVTAFSEESQQIDITDLNKQNGFILHFAQEGNLPLASNIRVYVGDREGGNVGRKVYVYHYNPHTRKLETLPYSSNYTINNEGYINLSIIQGSDYVVLYQKAPTSRITGMVHQVKITSSSNTLTLRDDKTSSQQLWIALPPTLTIVRKIEKKSTNDNLALGTVTIAYSSSNKKVAMVDEKGTIISVGKGKTIISATITLYTGKKRIVKIPITVKG